MTVLSLRSLLLACLRFFILRFISLTLFALGFALLWDGQGIILHIKQIYDIRPEQIVHVGVDLTVLIFHLLLADKILFELYTDIFDPLGYLRDLLCILLHTLITVIHRRQHKGVVYPLDLPR